eukprot:CAMPEP_0194565670 /NCGR_PEP_ID=MMETSP0292-20121207/4855_1 /TAXON_ID=39354 /ORGANISM="Heterosigma akashiwo, Strain CCMP2393" /LENGTH=227 /DNA_ID=CAMNT_0039415091 /DNA_START=204 /DNA_END=883 /DNA_ORIENTATION=-
MMMQTRGTGRSLPLLNDDTKKHQDYVSLGEVPALIESSPVVHHYERIVKGQIFTDKEQQLKKSMMASRAALHKMQIPELYCEDVIHLFIVLPALLLAHRYTMRGSVRAFVHGGPGLPALQLPGLRVRDQLQRALPRLPAAHHHGQLHHLRCRGHTGPKGTEATLPAMVPHRKCCCTSNGLCCCQARMLDLAVLGLAARRWDDTCGALGLHPGPELCCARVRARRHNV